MTEKEYASRLLREMKLTPNNLEGVVEQLRLCRRVIEGVEPNDLQIIQSMRELLPREVGEWVAYHTYAWNHTADKPDLDKFLQVVRSALVAKAPASVFTQRQVLGVQQATSNLQPSVKEVPELSTIIQELRGLVAAVAKMGQQQPPRGRGSRGGRSGTPDWIFAKGLCVQCGEKYQQGRACCNSLGTRNQAKRGYPGVVFAKSRVKESTGRLVI